VAEVQARLGGLDSGPAGHPGLPSGSAA
jgi:hypothetical protein